jgi:hypothetical protein
LQKIIQVVTAFLDSMMEIASGAIGGAANKVESTLAGLLTLAINFLAGFLGLGGIAEKVMDIINTRVRQPIDKALDKVIDWIVTMAKKLFTKGEDKKTDKEDKEDDPHVQAGLAAIDQEEASLNKGQQIERKDAEQIAAKVKAEYPIFKSISVVDGGGTWDYDYVASPGKRKKGFGKFTLFGKTEAQILRLAPKTWTKTKVDRGIGWKLVDENGIERVRFMKPNPKEKSAIWYRIQKGYWRWTSEQGEFLDEFGNVVAPTDPDFQFKTHIIYSGPE